MEYMITRSINRESEIILQTDSLQEAITTKDLLQEYHRYENYYIELIKIKTCYKSFNKFYNEYSYHAKDLKINDDYIFNIVLKDLSIKLYCHFVKNKYGYYKIIPAKINIHNKKYNKLYKKFCKMMDNTNKYKKLTSYEVQDLIEKTWKIKYV